MSINFDNSKKAIADANVVVSVEGLAVFNFNKENKNWEAILQRNLSSHTLKIIINKHVNGVTEKIAEYTRLGKNERFLVRASEPQTPNFHSVFEGEKDLKQVLDLSEMHGSRLFNTNHNLDLSFLSIADCVLYSQNVPNEIYKIQIPDKEPIIRKTTNTIGADMICATGSKLEIITTNNPNLIPPLVIEEGVVYQIIFDNSCHDPNPLDTDFKHHYDLLSVSQRAIVSSYSGDTDGGADGDGGEDDD
ncbi:MAG: hypothetical protein AAB336_06735, partial [Acidobacteriota bacterium]